MYLAHDKVGAYVLAQSYLAGCDHTKDLVACLGAAMFLKGIDGANEIVYGRVSLASRAN